VIGLDSGADDYITKPFGALELISRVKVALRKTDKMTTTIFQLKSLTLDKNKRTCSILQQEIALTSKEFDLLYHLLENQGKVIRRDELFKEIWGYDFMGETRTLDMHINFLRKKIIQADPTLANIIKTIRGVGYMVNCDD
jgi:two-component system alkaline phosphatase synthesis response regulator PhoP